jgi:hypothetical protein
MSIQPHENVSERDLRGYGSMALAIAIDAEDQSE